MRILLKLMTHLSVERHNTYILNTHLFVWSENKSGLFSFKTAPISAREWTRNSMAQLTFGHIFCLCLFWFRIRKLTSHVNSRQQNALHFNGQHIQECNTFHPNKLIRFRQTVVNSILSEQFNFCMTFVTAIL